MMQVRRKKTHQERGILSVGMFLAGCALLGMMLVIVIDVALRHTLNMPLPGTYDLVSILLLIMVFSGLAPVILSGSELVIDLLDPIFPDWMVTGLRVLAAAATTGVGLYLFIAMTRPALAAYHYGDRSLELGVPVWVLWIFAFFGIAGVAIAGSMRLVAELRSAPLDGRVVNSPAKDEQNRDQT